MAYSMVWGGESDRGMPAWNETSRSGNISEYEAKHSREVPGMPPFISRRTMSRENPLDFLISPFMMFTLVGGLISISAGVAIRNLTHKREVSKITADLKELYLTDEEKEVMSELEKAGSEMTQKELTDRTGHSRVKVHRIIQRLEAKKLVRKIPYGQTNKIILVDA